VRRIVLLLLLACALAGACVGDARAGLTVGVSDDSGKYSKDGGASFFGQLRAAGGTENAIVVWWDAKHPTQNPEQVLVDAAVTHAQLAGVRVVLDVYLRHAKDYATNPQAPAQYAAFLQGLARRYPGVRDFIVGNEPNQPRFWQPQFGAQGQQLSPAAYEGSLAVGYDALKAVDPGIRVLGFALSERGNDNPTARTNVSISPLRFIAAAGAAYRASGRAKPLMDAFAFHPYPRNPLDPLARGLAWPNAGALDLARVKQGLWDAFHGTAQKTVEDGLPIAVTEVGWQVGIPAGSIRAYTGQENVTTTSEANQASIYGELVQRYLCDANVSDLLFLHLIDETSLAGFQSGLIRADGTKRASYAAVESALAANGGRCAGAPSHWSHATGVVGLTTRFPAVSDAKTVGDWSLNASAAEGAAYRAVLVALGSSTPTPETIAAALAGHGPAHVALSTAGKLRPGGQSAIALPQHPVAAGRYVYVLQLVPVLAPERGQLVRSAVFSLR
jgi:hypothetical protein